MPERLTEEQIDLALKDWAKYRADESGDYLATAIDQYREQVRKARGHLGVTHGRHGEKDCTVCDVIFGAALIRSDGFSPSGAASVEDPASRGE